MRTRGIDYFENTRRATYVQQPYAVDNPLRFGGFLWRLMRESPYITAGLRRAGFRGGWLSTAWATCRSRAGR